MKKILLITLLLLTASITACSAKDKPAKETAEPQENSVSETGAEPEKKESEKKEPKEKESEKKESEKKESEKIDSEKIDSEKIESEEKEPEKKEPEEKGQAALSDDLYSYQIQIDETLYQFPMSYNEFVEKGWSFEGDTSEVLDSSSYLTSQIWLKDSLECYTFITNNEESSKPISDCQITGISLDGNNLKKVSSTFTLPGNIQYQTSSKEDIIAAYGEPTNETTSGTLLSYSDKNYSKVTFELDSDNMLFKITLQNMGH